MERPDPSIFQNFVEMSSVGHGLARLDGTIIYVNPAFARILGVDTPEDAVGKKVDAYYPEEFKSKVLNEVLPAVDREGHWTGELPFLSAKGELVPAIQHVSLIRDNEGVPRYTCNVATDIRGRKSVESALELKQISIDAASVNIFWVSREGRFIYVNDQTVKTLGYTRDELLKMNTWDIDLMMSQEIWPQHWLELKDKKTLVFEMVHQRKDGSRFPVEIHANYVNHDGQEYNFAFANDISERKVFEKELKRGKDLAENYLNIVGTMVLGINKSKQVMLINRKGCEILGYRREEILGKQWFDSFLPERLRKSVDAVAEKLLKGEIELLQYYENPVLRKGGEERLIAWHNTVLRNEQGEIIGLLSSGEDITDRKRTEQRILQERDFSDAVLDSLPGIFYVFNKKMQFLLWNANFERISEYSFKEIQHMTPLDFFEGQDKALIEERVREVFEKGLSDAEAYFKTKSGKKLFYHFTGRTIQIDKETCLIGVGIDMSEQKMVEEKLLKAMQEKETLLQEVHHRVKNNLLTLYSLVNLQRLSLSEGHSAEQALEDTKQRISAMGKVHRMLYASESFSEIDFAEYVRLLIDEIKMTYETSECPIEVDTELDPAVLDMDKSISLGLILNELLVNAFRHAFSGKERGRITVSLKRDQDHIKLDIKDDGIGMDSDPLSGRGKTLGLRLVAMLSQQLGADIGYKGGQGSLFTIVV